MHFFLRYVLANVSYRDLPTCSIWCCLANSALQSASYLPIHCVCVCVCVYIYICVYVCVWVYLYITYIIINEKTLLIGCFINSQAQADDYVSVQLYIHAFLQFAINAAKSHQFTVFANFCYFALVNDHNTVCVVNVCTVDVLSPDWCDPYEQHPRLLEQSEKKRNTDSYCNQYEMRLLYLSFLLVLLLHRVQSK